MNPRTTPRSASFFTIVFVLLWLGWAVLLPANFVAEYALGLPRWAPWYLSSAMLGVAAWVAWLGVRRRPIGRFAALVALGMTTGFAADFYGAYHRVLAGPDPLMFAIGAFTLGHLAYIAAGVDVAGRVGLRRGKGWTWTASICVGFWMIVAAMLWFCLVYPSHDHREARWPCVPYSLLLATTTGVMTALAALDRRFRLMALGAVLFLASDGFLAVKLFQNNAHRLGDACWITYGIGEMLIVFGAIRVIRDMNRAEQSATMEPA